VPNFTNCQAIFYGLIPFFYNSCGDEEEISIMYNSHKFIQASRGSPKDHFSVVLRIANKAKDYHETTLAHPRHRSADFSSGGLRGIPFFTLVAAAKEAVGYSGAFAGYGASCGLWGISLCSLVALHRR
jgi:hypothetical protein